MPSPRQFNSAGHYPLLLENPVEQIRAFYVGKGFATRPSEEGEFIGVLNRLLSYEFVMRKPDDYQGIHEVCTRLTEDGVRCDARMVARMPPDFQGHTFLISSVVEGFLVDYLHTMASGKLNRQAAAAYRTVTCDRLACNWDGLNQEHPYIRVTKNTRGQNVPRECGICGVEQTANLKLHWSRQHDCCAKCATIIRNMERNGYKEITREGVARCRHWRLDKDGKMCSFCNEHRPFGSTWCDREWLSGSMCQSCNAKMCQRAPELLVTGPEAEVRRVLADKPPPNCPICQRSTMGQKYCYSMECCYLCYNTHRTPKDNSWNDTAADYRETLRVYRIWIDDPSGHQCA